MNNDSYTGVQKAAILLITLGPEKAATIFKHLKEDEIEELTLEIANTRSVSPADQGGSAGRVLSGMPRTAVYCGRRYRIRKRTSGKSTRKRQGTGSYWQNLQHLFRFSPFEFIRKTDPAQLLNFIQDEHPQTIAMILIVSGSGTGVPGTGSSATGKTG